MTKKSISALEMQPQLGHKRYESIWAMMHIIRIVMGFRDDKYELDGVIELDDALLKTHLDMEKEDKIKWVRGSRKQSKILVIAKVVPKRGWPKKNKKSSTIRHV